MALQDEVRQEAAALTRALRGDQRAVARVQAEIAFAAQLCELHPGRASKWEGLIRQALAAATEALAEDLGASQAVARAEAALAPLAKVAKQYTIHCVGHGHIDMNWMWDWPETVATVNDTFSTVDRLMEEFPAFHYSQSQGSVYQVMKDYLPELYARVKGRVAEGRWEVTAATWVEASKNLSSGESMCRQLLYTSRFLQEEFGLAPGAVKIDWECDTFGHPQTVPAILNQAGVNRYYFHRGSNGPQLFWWEGVDGSRVLAFDDRHRGYNGRINPDIINGMVEFLKATGLKDWLFVFGVGDHGGGPTRQDLLQAQEMSTWPIFPRIVLSTTEAFYAAAERAADLPVVAAELNFVFEGCYTSQSNIKFANRKSENALVEAEAIALLARGLVDLPYPVEDLSLAWRHTMFSQFHDILPGSGVHATYEYARGLFQEVMARTTMIKTRALRALAARVDTASCCPSPDCPTADEGVQVGPGIGGGPGDVPAIGAVSRRGGEAPCCDPFVIFNPSPWPRTEVVTVRLWERDWPRDRLVVTDEEENVLPAQVISRPDSHYWAYRYTDVAFPAAEVPGLGYRAFTVQEALPPANSGPCTTDSVRTLENEFLRLEIQQSSGAVVHLVDKRSGLDLVPEGERLGVLEYFLETPHPMTAWIIGQIVKHHPFTEGATVGFPQTGPYVVSARAQHRFGDSTFALTISLSAGVPRVDFTLEADWLERGSREIGVPMLKVAFPLALSETVATYEVPMGSHTRPTDPREVSSIGCNYFPGNPGIDTNPAEVPALRWADLSGLHPSGAGAGATLVNDSKFGHRTDGNVLRLTLLRSTYDPDPLPELGQHTIRFALCPHDGTWTVADAARAGYDFNLPFSPVATTVQQGDLPARQGFAEVLTRNVMLSGLKQAEDSEAVIVRLYELEGKATAAQVRLDPVLAAPDAPAVQTDLLERPLTQNTARLTDGVLHVDIPAHGLVTVRVG